MDGSARHYGFRLTALVGFLGGAFPLSFSSRSAISTIRQHLSAALEQPVACVDQTGALTGNADGCNPDRRCGWQ
jgi:hypothetical protein